MKQFVDLRNKSLVLDFKMVKLFQYFQSFGEEKLHIYIFLVLFVREILHNVTDLPKMKCIHLFYMYCLEIVTDMFIEFALGSIYELENRKRQPSF